MKGTTEMAKKKTRRKKATGKHTGGWGKKVSWGRRGGLVKVAGAARKKATRRRRRSLALGTLGHRDSGTPKSHKPLKVLEKRLSRLTKIVAARKKNPKKWA